MNGQWGRRRPNSSCVVWLLTHPQLQEHPGAKTRITLVLRSYGKAEKVLLWPVNPRVLWVSWEKGISAPGMAVLITTAQTYRKATLGWGTWGRVSSTK